MNSILIYLSHPAQFHFYKFIIDGLKSKAVKVVILIKTKDVLEELVQEKGWIYQNIQPIPRKSGTGSIFLAMVERTIKIFTIARQEKVDLLLGTDASIAHAGFLLLKKSVTTLEDDYSVIKHLARLTYPFTSYIVTPECCDVGRWSYKKIGYQGYMKLAYLHPEYFTPSQNVLDKYNLKSNFAIIRLASLTAHHDKGIKGLTEKLVLQLIETIQKTGMSVYISSESSLPYEFDAFRLSINVKDIHHVLAGARLLISDSQSMSVEAALMGVPSIRYSDFAGRISVLEELEHTYQLTVGVPTSDPPKLIRLTEKLLSDNDTLNEFKLRRKQMLSEKIDVTAFMMKFIDSIIKL